ncbi:scaffolding protein [Thioalkalivibrio denitrificans]|uniref:Scaffolding protein n=1 Tax=Thioalkalivibrio denitrificans TaxID=108003 RepID=A0A1V3NAA9_9GAMM|nr:MipA/OmpV family protein [Thioalkalivibrio denitrificans]OOG21975.1 scaffolding protein [Thioalkalivibrio denitrificans]
MSIPRTNSWLIAAVLLAGASPAPAQWELGGAVIARDPIQRGADSDPLVVPMIQYSGERFFLRGIEAGMFLFGDESRHTSLFIRPRLDGYRADDDPFLDGMDARRNSADAGLRVSQGMGPWRLTATATTDALGRHHGQTLSGTVARSFGSPRLMFVPYAGLEWMSASLVDYYYGVSSSEARSDRPAYDGSATVNVIYGARVVAPLTPRVTFQGIVAGTRYGNEVNDSPLTTDRYRAISILGVSYRF